MSKSKKSSTNLFLCEKCGSNVSCKDLEQHSTDCPPSTTNLSHSFARHGILYGVLDTKVSDEIKGMLPRDKDNLVFISEVGMQICGVAIGEYVVVSDVHSKHSYARIVWPTSDKSSIAFSFTKSGIEASFEDKNIHVCVTAITNPVYEARHITLVAMSNAKKVDLHPDLLTRLHKSNLNRLLTEGNKIVIRHFGKLLKFEVKSINASNVVCSNAKSVDLEGSFAEMSVVDGPQFCKVVETTRFSVFRNEGDYNEKLTKTNLMSKIGGLDEEISEIKNLMNVALGKSKAISRSIINRGVLLFGSSGTGKTLVTKALAEECAVNVVEMSLTDLYKYEGNAEETITKLFEDAINLSPSLVLIDEIDLFFPSKNSRISDTDKKIMSCLLNLFDHINGATDCEVFVLATSNKPDSIDPAIRRCGRLEREIEIPTPNPKGRLDILKKLLADVPLDVDKDELKEIANSAHGFVGSDLVSLCSRAALHATKREDSKICLKDLKFALTRISPSAMREVQIEVPDVKWTDIGGQSDLKFMLRQAVEWPLKHPESFVRMGITPPRGVLMFGPPGCSKTMIAKALATESGLNFLSVKGPELFSKWVGESEKAVRDLFRKARQVAPSVIFFDEIDALGGERSSGSSTSVQERVLAQLLTELDGVTPLGDVTVLAATNRPDRIDKALLRPGRLDRNVYVPLPDEYTRKEIFKLKLSKMPALDVDIDILVQATDGYSGAEVIAVCHEAAMKALEESLKSEHVTMEHFKHGLERITPRTPPSLLKIYENYVK